MTTETTNQTTDTETPANYLSLRPWVFGLFIFLVANMLYIAL